MSWRPLLDGELARRARAAVEDIAEVLIEKVPTSPELAHGACGPALFYAYHGLVCEDEGSDVIADRIVEEMLGRLDQALMPMLYGGFPGCGWVIEHMFGQDEDVGEPFDARLAEILEYEPWDADYDLISGLTGMAVYALERGERPAAGEIVARIVWHLEQSAIEEAGRITWHTAPYLLPPHQREAAPDGYYNLGVAHGVPATARVLAAAAKAWPELAAARRLADGAADWIVGQRRGDDAGSAYAMAVGDGRETATSRLAWCYGDPGVACALIAAGRDLLRGDLIDIGVEVAADAATRSAGDGLVRDAGLCHGAVGLAHIYNRMHQATGDHRLAAAALRYYQLALEMRGPAGIAGFTELVITDEHPAGLAQANPGFLTGAAGIGLALLAAIGRHEPEWDRLLACDATPL